MEDDDIAKQDDITVIQKRRFFEWRAQLLETDDASESESEDKYPITPARSIPSCGGAAPSACLGLPLHLENLTARIASSCSLAEPLASGCLTARKSAPIRRSSFAPSSSASLRNRSPSVRRRAPAQVPPVCSARLSARCMPQPTPRTQTARKVAADTPIEVLVELERLDMALQEELARSAQLELELQEERERSSRIAAEKQVNEENHSRDMAMLEQLIQKVMSDNELLKNKVVALEANDTTSETKSEISFLPCTRRPATPLEEEMIVPFYNDTASEKSEISRVTDRRTETARHSMVSAQESFDEPEMEPRRTMQPFSPAELMKFPKTMQSLDTYVRTTAPKTRMTAPSSFQGRLGEITVGSSASVDVTERYLANSLTCWPESHQLGQA